MRILLDVDGVVADFVQAVCIKYGLQKSQLRKEWQVLGCVAELMNSDKKKIWNAIQHDHYFWASMPKTKEANDLFRLLNNLTSQYKLDPIAFVTSTPEPVHQVRTDWIMRWFGAVPVVYTDDKFLLAQSGLLIDDKFENVERFKHHQGQAILYPNEWNNNFISWENTKEMLIQEVSESFKHLKRNFKEI